MTRRNFLKTLFLGWAAHGRPIALKPEHRRTHMHVIGSSGSGKSKFLEWMIRGDLKNQQGFALLDPHGTLVRDVAEYCAHRVLDREIIYLNLSDPSTVIGFNPFQRAPAGDISVQVDRRISAVMHAWNAEDTDQTPTLARTLRCVFTLMIERNLGLRQVQHLIDFNAQTIRGHLIEQLTGSPLVQKEWRELQQLKAKDWRDETLSAKNRLFKFLTSDSLCRFMGVPGMSINLQEVMDQGKILLVNLAPSDHLSHENARAFGALLVNEFFETALRRKLDALSRSPARYYLYMDEFEKFVSLDVANMLDEVRKFELFMILAHQRFGQLDENITDAVLTNCGIKVLFGGLPVDSARRMAEELFIGELDPKKIKVSLYQTKFWPKYTRDHVYTHTTGHSSSSSSSHNSSVASSSGTSSTQNFFQPTDWFSLPESTGFSEGSSSGSTSGSSDGYADGEAYAESESVADVPILLPVPFEELSSVQYYTTEEQLTELTAALKEQFPRHGFIKILSEKTQPLLVPLIKPTYTSARNFDWYTQRQLKKQHALPGAEVDRLIAEQETALLQAVSQRAKPTQVHQPVVMAGTAPQNKTCPVMTRTVEQSIWNRGAAASSTSVSSSPASDHVCGEAPVPSRKRGPKTDVENHARVAAIVGAYSEQWTRQEALFEICDRLDRDGVPVPKTWPTRNPPSRSWSRALQNEPSLVVKALRYHLEAAQGTDGTGEN